MSHHKNRLYATAMSTLTITEEIRKIYDDARTFEGLRSRAAFMRACHAYSNIKQEVPDHLVPSHVARILNPNLKFRTGERSQYRRKIN